MTARQEKAAKRQKVWAETKSAACAYARNPCAATEQQVESAVSQLRHMNDDTAPCPPSKRHAGVGR